MKGTLTIIAQPLAFYAKSHFHHGAPMQRLRNKSQRGFALIMALVLIALVSAIVAEFQYSSRVGLQLAVQARDSLAGRAECDERNACAGTLCASRAEA